MEKFDHNEVTGRIRFVMKKLGYNQAALAHALGITQPAVSKYLNDRMPPVEIFYRLAILGEVSMEWLLTGQDNYSKLKVAEPGAAYQGVTFPPDRIARLPRRIQEALYLLIDHLNK